MLDCLRKKNNFDFKELLSADAIIFLKIIYFFLCPQKVEKTTLKSCSEILKFLSALLPLAAQTEEFMFQNVAYRQTVYRTGLIYNKKFSKKNYRSKAFRKYGLIIWTHNLCAVLFFND